MRDHSCNHSYDTDSSDQQPPVPPQTELGGLSQNKRKTLRCQPEGKSMKVKHIISSAVVTQNNASENIRPTFHRMPNTSARRAPEETRPVHQSTRPASSCTEPGFSSQFALPLALHIDPIFESMLESHVFNTVRSARDVVGPGFAVIPHHLHHPPQSSSLCGR